MAKSAYRETWEFGSPLDHAWFHFAPEPLKDQYRDAPHEHRMAALKILMEGEVALKISCGELIACGIEIPIKNGGEIEQISNLIFSSQSTKIDWTHSEIEGLGIKYHEVRVVESNRICGVADINSEHFDRKDKNSKEPEFNPDVKKKRRPNTYPPARAVLMSLYKENPANILTPASRLIEQFNEQFPTQAAKMGLQASKLTARTLQNHLTLFRKELEEMENPIISN